MEASTLQPPAATLAHPRIAIGAPLLRFRSDDQLVALFRAGHEEAFRAIHDRYNRRLFAYARQMLPARQDAEDALQDVFVRAYSGLRASDRDLALRAWLFRVAHNRCVDELRKPAPPPPEVLLLVRSSVHDPLAELDLRESLRRLVGDIRRLPDQQRSALLMRELAGLSYAEVASSLGTSVGAVKSLLVRARLTLAQAAEARETACTVIREQLVEAHDRGVRPNANTRKHVRDCSGCKSFRGELRGVSRQLAAVTPATGALGFLTKLIGFSGGGGGAGGGVALLGGGGSAASTGGLALGANHLATLIVAAVATAGGAVEIQRTILPAVRHPAHVLRVSAHHPRHPSAAVPHLSSTSAVQATAVQSDLSRAADAADPAGTGATTITRKPGSAGAARPRSARKKLAKRRALSGSSTAAATTVTSELTSTSGSCTTATTAPPAASGSATTSSSSTTTTTAATPPSTSSTAPTSSSSSTTATSAPTCNSSTVPSTQAPTTSSGSSGTGTGDGTGSTGSTSPGSEASPSGSEGSSTDGSGTTSG